MCACVCACVSHVVFPQRRVVVVLAPAVERAAGDAESLLLGWTADCRVWNSNDAHVFTKVITSEERHVMTTCLPLIAAA